MTRSYSTPILKWPARKFTGKPGYSARHFERLAGAPEDPLRVASRIHCQLDGEAVGALADAKLAAGEDFTEVLKWQRQESLRVLGVAVRVFRGRDYDSRARDAPHAGHQALDCGGETCGQGRAEVEMHYIDHKYSMALFRLYDFVGRPAYEYFRIQLLQAGVNIRDPEDQVARIAVFGQTEEKP